MSDSPESPLPQTEEESVLRYTPDPPPAIRDAAENIAYNIGIEALRGELYPLTMQQKRSIASAIQQLFVEFEGSQDVAHYLIHLIFDPDVDLHFITVLDDL
ncbi:hypothetical protein VNI00_008775 [Paramarasmius palmivorus]|uniref:Uncharacterized protein n=1 Tax=Paramarasmius palmivorus TaxID=297713 RepID=A0AAW0CWJ6_9AGAR